MLMIDAMSLLEWWYSRSRQIHYTWGGIAIGSTRETWATNSLRHAETACVLMGSSSRIASVRTVHLETSVCQSFFGTAWT